MQKLDLPIPETGTLTQVAADLYWARFALPFRLNHINLYMIDTDAGWLLVDAGINQDETAAQWQVQIVPNINLRQPWSVCQPQEWGGLIFASMRP